MYKIKTPPPEPDMYFEIGTGPLGIVPWVRLRRVSKAPKWWRAIFGDTVVEENTYWGEERLTLEERVELAAQIIVRTYRRKREFEQQWKDMTA